MIALILWQVLKGRDIFLHTAIAFFVWDLKRLFRPFRARAFMGAPLTQAFDLGFVISPLWGSKKGKRR
jgi:hypothetical protein